MAGKRKKKKEGELHLSDKKHPPLGIASAIFGIISFAVFAAICIISGKQKGQADITVGFIGVLCFIISLIGFIMAWISLHKDDIKPVFPTIGSLINGLLIIIYMLLYIWGTVF